MLNAIIRFSVRNKLIIGLLTLAWIIWGVIELSRLPVDALPDITSNQVQVITVTPALASPEVERVITFPIEQACSNIPGIKEFRSISRFGLSVVTLVFDDKTDVYWARQQVSERLIRIREEIPREAGIPELAPLTTGLGEIYQYVLKPRKGFEQQYDLAELRTIQDWIVRRQLLGTPGVADVSSFGGLLKQYEVAVNTERLRSMGLSITDVFNALEQNNQNSGGAYIEKGNELLFIRTEGLVGSIEDIEKIRIKTTTSGIPVYIGSVADVRLGSAVRYGAMTYGQDGEVAGAVVLMLKGDNASKVVSAVKKKMESIRKTLPKGVELVPFYDRTKIVNRAIDTVTRNLLEGALIVIFILVLFLGNFRASLIVASVIPLSMLFAVGMMNLFGVSGNLMSLGALDFGLIVDGAVIIVEAVMHRLYHRHLYKGIISGKDMDDAVITSSSRMMNAAVFGQAIILIVYLPILSLTGIEGKMFRPMAQTVIFALLGAFILSLTYVPMMTSLVMSRKARDNEGWTDKVMDRIKSGYTLLLDRIFRFPRAVMAASLALFVFAMVIASRLGGEFIPKLEEGDFAVDARLLTGSTLTATVETSLQASRILQKFPEVERIVTRIGSSEIPTDPMPVEMTDIMVTLREKDKWTSAQSYDELANMMSDSLRNIPGFTTGFQYPIQMRFNELIAGARQDVVCKIFGENLDTLAAYAARVGGLVQSIDGARDIYIETVTGLPQIVIRYRRDLMAMYGLGISDVNRAIRAAFAGESAGKVFENERRFDLVVRLSDVSRRDIEHVRGLVITGAGVQVPLAEVADIRVEQGPNQIQREDAKRRVIVGFNIRGRDVQTVVNELQQKLSMQIPLPAGYYVHYGGQFENLVEAKQRLSIAVPVALALIFIMLYFAFGSIKLGLLIFTAIPLSAIGGILSLWLRGMPFSISAGVGFIALFGVAVLNGIVLITEFNRLKREGMDDVKQIIREGSLLRLRPVLMTASVASFGFLPMALSHSAGAEVQRPLATVVIGGLITATLLTLVVLPLLYYWFSGERRMPNKLTILLPLLLSGSLASAQPTGRTVSLDSMISMANRQNLSLQASRKATDYWQAISSRIFELPSTQMGAEYGSINSFNRDTRFYINQPFLLPGVYGSRRALYGAQFNAGKADVRLREAALRREVRMNFYQMQDLLERLVLLQGLDSAYGKFIEAASLRYKTGESPLLERTAAETEYSRLVLQRQQLMADLQILQERNALLLRINERLLPEMDSKAGLESAGSIDTASHPLLAYWQAQQEVHDAQIRSERATRLPELSLGYSNLSIIGWQSTDGVTQKYYGSGDRFNTVSLGLGLPLFNGASKARVQAGEVNKEVARLQQAQAGEQLQSLKDQASAEYDKQAKAVAHYRTTGLKQADQIISQSLLAYRSGDMGYMEWINLMSRAVQIRLGYLDALLAMKLAGAELEYLKGN